jgi:hypothetical protein
MRIISFAAIRVKSHLLSTCPRSATLMISMTIRVKRFSSSTELSVCSSELEVPDTGWAVVTTESEAVMRNVEGFSGECVEVFRDGEFMGDNRLLERTVDNGEPFTELIYKPVPDED